MECSFEYCISQGALTIPTYTTPRQAPSFSANQRPSFRPARLTCDTRLRRRQRTANHLKERLLFFLDSFSVYFDSSGLYLMSARPCLPALSWPFRPKRPPWPVIRGRPASTATAIVADRGQDSFNPCIYPWQPDYYFPGWDSSHFLLECSLIFRT
jgi:hypothetical protein